MKTNLEFVSEKFLAEPEEEEQINPDLYGKRLAEYLATKISARGFKVLEPIAEDWGWRVEIQNSEFPLWIGCGNYEDASERGFLCFIEPSKPFVRKWFKKIVTRPIVEKLGQALEAAVRDPEAAATRIRWQD